MARRFHHSRSPSVATAQLLDWPTALALKILAITIILLSVVVGNIALADVGAAGTLAKETEIESPIASKVSLSTSLKPASAAHPRGPDSVVISNLGARADLVKVSTPPYKVDFSNFEPRLGEYKYGVSWQGIPAASASVTVRKEGAQFYLSAFARTARAIDMLYALRYQADGIVSAFDLMPERTVIRHQEGSRIRNMELSFTPNGEVFTVRTQNNKKPAEILRFDPENQMFEPFSAALIARTLDWTKGNSYAFDTFNGKSRYLITLTSVGEESVWLNGKSHDCYVISPTVKKLTENQKADKLRTAKIYVTKDNRRDIIKIVSEVFIGSVVTELESFNSIQEADAVFAKALGNEDEGTRARLLR